MTAPTFKDKALALIQNIQPETKKLLKEGDLLRSTREVCRKLVTGHPFGVLVSEELCLTAAGQVIRSAIEPNGRRLRMYHHILADAPPGHSKSYNVETILGTQGHGVLRSSPFRYALGDVEDFDKLRLPHVMDSATLAVVTGTASEDNIIPSVLCDNNFIVTEEAATLLGNTGGHMEVNDALRALLERGAYARDMKALFSIQSILAEEESREDEHRHTLEEHALDPSYKPEKFKPDRKATRIRSRVAEVEEMGMKLDFMRGQLWVLDAHASMYLASARWTLKGKRPLLELGDLTRFRPIAWHPGRDELKGAVEKSAGFPPMSLDTVKLATIQEAWQVIFALKNFQQFRQFPIPEADYPQRVSAWKALVKDLEDEQPMLNDEQYSQFINMRSVADFYRVAYQHALLYQFKYDFGGDFSVPDSFAVMKDDWDYACERVVDLYVPSMLAVMSDIIPTLKFTKEKADPVAETGVILLRVLRDRTLPMSVHEAIDIVRAQHSRKDMTDKTVRRHLTVLDGQGIIEYQPYKGVSLPKEDGS